MPSWDFLGLFSNALSSPQKCAFVERLGLLWAKFDTFYFCDVLGDYTGDGNLELEKKSKL